MTTIGLLGGMSWHSSIEYYRLINTRVATVRGGHASARIVLSSLDFAEIRECQLAEDWDRAGELLADAARGCVAAGADVVAIATNLMHKVAPRVEAALTAAGDVPLLHIADAVAEQARRRGVRRVGLLATRWVMEETFYADRLARHGIDVVVPDADARVEIDRIIFDELTQGRVVDASRATYLAAVAGMADAGAEAVVLACTEIASLISTDDTPLPLIDSCAAHASALADRALTDRPLADRPLAAADAPGRALADLPG